MLKVVVVYTSLVLKPARIPPLLTAFNPKPLIVYTLALKYSLCRYIGPNVYTIWAHGPLYPKPLQIPLYIPLYIFIDPLKGSLMVPLKEHYLGTWTLAKPAALQARRGSAGSPELCFP